MIKRKISVKIPLPDFLRSYPVVISLKQLLSNLEKIIFLLVLFHLFILPIIFTTRYHDNYDIPKYITHLLLTAIEGFLLVVYLREQSQTSKKHIVESPKSTSKFTQSLAIFLLIYFFAAVAGKDLLISFLGTRESWLLSVVSIISFGLFGVILSHVLRSSYRLKLTSLVLILSADLISFSGILLKYFLDWDPLQHGNRLASTMGHPIDLANFLVLTLPLAIFFNSKDNLWGKLFKNLSIIIQITAIVLTLTRAAWISIFIMAVIWALVNLIRRRKNKRQKNTAKNMKSADNRTSWSSNHKITLIAGFILIPICLFLIAPIRERMLAFFTQSKTENSFYMRLSELRSAFRIFLANPLTGIGPENLLTQFPLYREAWMNLTPDWLFRASYIRNIYVHLLVTTGIPGLLFLLIFLGRIVRNALRFISLTNITAEIRSFALSFVGWLIVHIFYYPSIPTLIILTISTTVIIANFDKISGNETSRNLPAKPLRNQIFNRSIITLLSAFLLIYGFSFERAEFFFNKSLQTTKNRVSVEYIDKAIRFLPIEPAYYRQKAYILSEELTQKENPGNYSQEIVTQINESINNSLIYGPKDLNNYDVAASIFYSMHQKFPEKQFIDRAIDYGEIVIRLSPTQSYFYDNLGLYYMEARKYPKAQEAFKKALKLKPDQMSSYLHSAEVDIQLENYNDAEDKLIKVLAESNNPDQICLATSRLKIIQEKRFK
jgi:O-antigen ligase